jgi:hypothetical protein
LGGASYGNEGKIHLGHVYAMDTSLRTGLTMMQGALAFAPLLERWCGPLDWRKWRCKPFRYAVMPGSLATIQYLEDYYEKLWRSAQEDKQVSFSNYMGVPLTGLWNRATDTLANPLINGAPVPCIETTELAIDTRYFNPILSELLRANRLITVHEEHSVSHATRLADGFELEVATPKGPLTMQADVVINCSWSDRIRLDKEVGFTQQEINLSYRVKHRIIVKPLRSIDHLAPVTMVQGPFGDMVPLKDGMVYLSWYPECRTYFGNRPPISEATEPENLQQIAHRTIEVFGSFFPALKDSTVVSCRPCIIVAKGDTDVHDPDSELHQRSEGGPRGSNGWWSVETSKLTLAPFYGEKTGDLVAKSLGHHPAHIVHQAA